MQKNKFIICTLIIMLLNIFFIPIYAISTSKEISAISEDCVRPAFTIVDNVGVNSENKEVKQKVDSKPVATNVEFSFKSKSQILMEASTGKIIYENNAYEKCLPASVTKVMTLLLIMEAIDSGKISYEDKVTCSANASSMGGSQIWFKEGEEITVDEALKCICIVSANDVCIAMAEMIGGSETNFVKMMNDKAAILGMTGTNFVNSHGIDDENHYTTARDIAVMSRELILNHPDIIKYTTIWMDSIRGGTFGLSNTNKLIRYYEGATGLKTGYTSKALYNLSATATKNNMSLIAVITGAPTSDIRNEETKQLLNFGFTNFDVEGLLEKGIVVDELMINKYLGGKVKIVTESDISLLKEKGKKVEAQKEVDINKNITAPIKAGSKVGEIKYKDQEGNLIGKTNLVIKDKINKSGVLDYIKHSFKIYGLSVDVFNKN